LEVEDECLNNEDNKAQSQKQTSNWRKLKLTKQYELNGDSKFVEANGSNNQTAKHEFKSWK
jgi:hypothetical protein